MAATAGLAVSGLLARFDLRPPPFGLLIVVLLAVALGLGVSRIGTSLATLPLSALVGLNAFRFPLELVMHRAVSEGVMPEQMTYTGRNFDIATGLTAALLAPAIARGLAPRWLIATWNAMGTALLANVVIIAVISTPVFGAFGAEPSRLNTFVAFFPFVWLPAVLVATALMLHVVVARALRLERGTVS